MKFDNFMNDVLLYDKSINIYGSAGSGKTYLDMILALNAVKDNKKVIIVDFVGEYQNFANAAKGTFIDMSAKLFNPFNIVLDNEFSISDKISYLSSFISLLFDGKLDSGYASYLCEKLYKNFNLEFNKSKVNIKIPTLEDFYNLIINEVNDNSTFLNEAKTLAISYKENNTYDLFNCENSSLLENIFENNITVLNLSKIDREMQQLCFPMILMLLEEFGKIKNKNKDYSKDVVIIEEPFFVSDKAEYVNIIRKFVIRKRFLPFSFVSVSSTCQYLYGVPYNHSIALDSCKMNIFFRQYDVLDLNKIFGITKLDELTSLKYGDCLVNDVSIDRNYLDRMSVIAKKEEKDIMIQTKVYM